MINMIQINTTVLENFMSLFDIFSVRLSCRTIESRNRRLWLNLEIRKTVAATTMMKHTKVGIEWEARIEEMSMAWLVLSKKKIVLLVKSEVVLVKIMAKLRGVALAI